MDDLLLVDVSQLRELLDVLDLHGVADTTARQQKEHRLGERAWTIDERGGAVVDAIVVRFDGDTAELHRTHRRQYTLLADELEGPLNLRFERLERGEALEVHHLDARDGFVIDLAPLQLRDVAGVLTSV